MPATRLIPEERLATYFELYTKEFLLDGLPRAVDVEVLTPDLGDQFTVLGARLLGITYDPGTCVLELELDIGDHRIDRPSEVWVIEEQDGFLAASQVSHSGETRELVSVKRVGVRRI